VACERRRQGRTWYTFDNDKGASRMRTHLSISPKSILTRPSDLLNPELVSTTALLGVYGRDYSMLSRLDVVEGEKRWLGEIGVSQCFSLKERHGPRGFGLVLRYVKLCQADPGCIQDDIHTLRLLLERATLFEDALTSFPANARRLSRNMGPHSG
jgi:hypothetical protein